MFTPSRAPYASGSETWTNPLLVPLTASNRFLGEPAICSQLLLYIRSQIPTGGGGQRGGAGVHCQTTLRLLAPHLLEV